eukprot:CAMPEP_0170489894 /NCGR_PEP_ID=MMETSP0208-20121228/8185_1 /TAXON_ID=197538 /ORGANISM="Strombidium inclinatum, Strain S3" /LENGTH=50 /DNA_ID=CAMNT_0010765039 /DNA_START=2360 /DNA_END=2512 /DNA_ORIENTATION=-
MKLSEKNKQALLVQGGKAEFAKQVASKDKHRKLKKNSNNFLQNLQQPSSS